MARELDTFDPADAAARLSGWAPAGGRAAIVRTFRFADFKQAFAFMTAAALKAEQMDHHPEWSNVYSTVEVLLATHDAGGVTRLDVELAGYLDGLADRLGAR